MGYTHLTTDERERIAHNLAAGWSIPDIARDLGRSPSTLYRELGRNTLASGRYSPSRAAAAYQARRQAARPPWRLEADGALRLAVIERLKRTWSPEQIAGRLRREHPDRPELHVGFKTIYRFLARDRRSGGTLFTLLPQRGGYYRKRHGRAGRQGPILDRRPLAERPPIVECRGRLGDFEGDTICTGRRPIIVTLVDRRSRYLLAGPLRRARPTALNRAVARLLGPLPGRLRRTLTVDNGREFAGHRALEAQLALPIYFAPPYQSNRRATNENTNGLLRYFFPKKARLRPTGKQIDRATALINNRPRKCLGWRTPAEVFFSHG